MRGNALLQLGGPARRKAAGPVGGHYCAPAGTGHISLSHSDDFAVVGAYPDGAEPDLIKLEDERPDVVTRTVDLVPVPKYDPFYGESSAGIVPSWKERVSRMS